MSKSYRDSRWKYEDDAEDFNKIKKSKVDRRKEKKIKHEVRWEDLLTHQATNEEDR